MTNVSTNGTSASVPVLRGLYGLEVAGPTWGGGIVQPQQQINGSDWTNFIKSDGSTLTYSGNQCQLLTLLDCNLRYITTSATGSTLFATGRPAAMVGGGQAGF